MILRATALATSFLLSSTALVQAQSAACGGAGSGGLWMGGAETSSDISSAGAPLAMSGMPVAEGGTAVGLFTVGQGMTVRVEAAGRGNGDSVLELYDATGQLVVTDDDSGGGLSSRAEVALEAGSYCLAVRGFGDAALDADLQVSRLEQPALTVGLAGGFAGTDAGPEFVGIQPCTGSTAAVDLANGPLDAALSQGGVAVSNTVTDVPYYRFMLSSRQPVTIRAENPNADPYIYLFDGSGTLLGENDDYDSLNSRIDVTGGLAPGTYCVGMRALSDPDQTVTLRVAGFDAAAVAAEGYGLGDTPPPPDGSLYPVTMINPLPSVSLRDVAVPGGQAAWFALGVESPGVILVTADEVSDSDPVIALYDPAGRLVAENDDANDTLNSELVARVGPGIYMLSVRQFSPGYQGVIRVGVQRFVPAP